MSSAGDRPSRPQRRRARKLVEEALAAEPPIRRMELARKAIEADDTVADAWGILAEEEPDPATSATLFAEALKRVEAALGKKARPVIAGATYPEPEPEASVETGGQPAASIFWEDPAADSYVRSRTGLGLALLSLEGRDAEAVEHMLGVLRLDPLDRMELSHHVVAPLLRMNTKDSDDRARHIMDQHPCDCVHHCYWDALLSFRQYGGDDERTIQALAGAIGSGPVVPPFLFGEVSVPPDVPSPQDLGRMGIEGEEHALMLSASVASELLPLWEGTPGAKEWLTAKWQRLGSSAAALMGDPSGSSAAAGASLLAGRGNPDSVLAAMLGSESSEEAGGAAEGEDEAWREGDAGFMFWREKDDEDVALSRFRDGLEGLIQDRAEKAGLTLKRGTAPFPGALEIFGNLSGGFQGSPFRDLPQASPLSYLAGTGKAGQVAELADALLSERVWDFSIFAEDTEVVEVFYEMGAEVFEGPVGEMPGT